MLANSVTLPVSEHANIAFWDLVGISVCGVALWTAVRWEGLPLKAFGIRVPTVGTLGRALELALYVRVAYRIAVWISEGLNLRTGSETGEFFAAMPMWLYVLSQIRAGFVEETLFRGYLIASMVSLTGRVSVAVACSIVAFAASHILGWGIGPWLIGQFAASVVLTVFYIWHRDLIANVAGHALVNISFLVF